MVMVANVFLRQKKNQVKCININYTSSQHALTSAEDYHIKHLSRGGCVCVCDIILRTNLCMIVD